MDQVQTTWQIFMQFSVVKASNWYWSFSVFNCSLLSKEFANTLTRTLVTEYESTGQTGKTHRSRVLVFFWRTTLPMSILKIGGRFSLFQDVGYLIWDRKIVDCLPCGFCRCWVARWWGLVICFLGSWISFHHFTHFNLRLGFFDQLIVSELGFDRAVHFHPPSGVITHWTVETMISTSCCALNLSEIKRLRWYFTSWHF